MTTNGGQVDAKNIKVDLIGDKVDHIGDTTTYSSTCFNRQVEVDWKKSDDNREEVSSFQERLRRGGPLGMIFSPIFSTLNN